MGTPTFSGRDIIVVLRNHGLVPTSRVGSHVKLRYENESTDEVRVVTVPMHDEVRVGTLRNIAEQAGATDFEAFCQWVESNR